MKLISLALMALIIGVFTQCVATNTEQVGGSGGSHKTTFVTPKETKDEAQVINEAQVSTGIKSYEQILHTMAALTGVDVLNGSVQTVYKQVETTLPTDNDIKVFLPPHQLAITKLAAEFCHVLVDNGTLRAQIWPDFNFNATPNNAFNSANRDMLIEQSIEAFWGGVVSDEERSLATDELQQLMDDLLLEERTDQSSVTRNVVKGVCTAVLSSAHVTLL